MSLANRLPRNFIIKRVFYLFLACVLALAGAMQLRASVTSLLAEEKIPLQRLYEEIEEKRILNLRTVEQRQGRKPIERVLKQARAPRIHPVLRPQLYRLPGAPRAPPHLPRAPPFVA